VRDKEERDKEEREGKGERKRENENESRSIVPCFPQIQTSHRVIHVQRLPDLRDRSGGEGGELEVHIRDPVLPHLLLYHLRGWGDLALPPAGGKRGGGAGGEGGG
jgi:hypothetical protein